MCPLNTDVLIYITLEEHVYEFLDRPLFKAVHLPLKDHFLNSIHVNYTNIREALLWMLQWIFHNCPGPSINFHTRIDCDVKYLYSYVFMNTFIYRSGTRSNGLFISKDNNSRRSFLIHSCNYGVIDDNCFRIGFRYTFRFMNL